MTIESVHMVRATIKILFYIIYLVYMTPIWPSKNRKRKYFWKFSSKMVETYSKHLKLDWFDSLWGHIKVISRLNWVSKHTNKQKICQMSNRKKFSPSLSKKGNRELIFISCWKAVLKYRMDTDHQKMLSKQSLKNCHPIPPLFATSLPRI